MNEVSRANYIIAKYPEVFLDAKYNMMNKMFLCTFWSGRKTWLTPSDIINHYNKDTKTESVVELSIDDLLDLVNDARRLGDKELERKWMKELRERTNGLKKD